MVITHSKPVHQLSACHSPCVHFPGEANALETYLESAPPPITYADLNERRFQAGHYCPHCGGKELHRHGKYRGRQRFKCLSCSRTFNERTNTPMHGTHYPEKWGAYVVCMALGWSLRKTARSLEISLPTAFYWRHKLVSALRHGVQLPDIGGIVELDEMYVLESQKGNRNLKREPRRRGTGKSMTRAPSHDRACVLAINDRADHTLATVVGMGPLHVFWVEKLTKKMEFEPTTLCVDNRQAYWSLSLRQKVPRALFQYRFERRGLLHIRNVDRLLTHFKEWLLPFRGVATKYLENYVKWFMNYYRASRSGMCPHQFARSLLQKSVKIPVRTTNSDLFPVGEEE